MATRTAASKSRTAGKATPKAPAKTANKPTAKPVAKPVVKPVANVAKKAMPASPVLAAKSPKLKARLVRDSFTMPQSDFDLIAVLKERALGFKRPTKKSELLRAGLQVLAGLNDASLQAGLNALAPLKPGRPKRVE